MPFRPAYEGQFPSLGWQVGAHIEHYMGLELLREQQERLVRLYRLDLRGDRVVRRAALRRPKGAGKSPEGGYIGFAELTGPVVFAGWDASGQPVGRPHSSPWVQFAAVSEDQTDNVLVWLYEVLADRPATLTDLHVDLGRTRIYLTDRPGRVEPVTAAAGSREGQPITFGVLDQTEAWKRENGGVRLAAVMRRNAAKTGGWTYELQNAPEPGDGSVADATARSWERGQSGVFFDTREPAVLPELSDRPALVAALDHVYGESRKFVPLDRIADECTDSDTEPSDAYRFYLNVARPSEERAFDVERWRRPKADGGLSDAAMVVPDGDLVVVGFDGARFEDSTALVGTHVALGHQFVIGIWERPEAAPEDWEVDEVDVTDTLASAFDRWDVWRVYADPPYWESTVASWAGRWGDKRVVSWWTNRNKQMAYALRSFVSAQRSGVLSHDGSSHLASHVGHARKKPLPVMRDEDGKPMWTIRKESPSLKIDAAMAACLSWECREDAVRAGAHLQQKKRFRAGSM